MSFMELEIYKIKRPSRKLVIWVLILYALIGVSHFLLSRSNASRSIIEKLKESSVVTSSIGPPDTTLMLFYSGHAWSSHRKCVNILYLVIGRDGTGFFRGRARLISAKWEVFEISAGLYSGSASECYPRPRG